jgi:hypothetical protein
MYPPGSLGPGVFGPQAVQQPPQLQHPLGRHAVSQAVEVLAGQLLDRRGQRRQVVRSTAPSEAMIRPVPPSRSV